MYLKFGYLECFDQKVIGNNYFVLYMYKYFSSSWGIIEIIIMVIKYFLEFMLVLNLDKIECF